MGFSVKLAPGVRVRVSSHGVRAGVGPRVARVQVGTGRTGFSSGLGPFSVYGSVGGKRRRKSGGRSSGRPSAAALERQASAARRVQGEADKAREAQRLAAIFQETGNDPDTVLATLAEAFEDNEAPAAAVGIDGRAVLDCMVAGRWTRMAFDGVRWADADAGNILTGTATELVLNQKRGQILPVDLSAEPEIRDLLSAMGTTDPASED